MFESQIYNIRDKIRKAGARGDHLILNSCAPPAQIAELEAELGLALPDEYREFVLRIGDGGWIGLLQIGAASMNNVNPNYHLIRVSATAFPLRHFAHPDGWEMHCLLLWDELSPDEQSNSHIALCLGMWRGRSWPVLILSGPKRGQVFHGCFYAELEECTDLDAFDGLKFLDWLERVLDLQASRTL